MAPNNVEKNNTRRKKGRPKKQRKTRLILGDDWMGASVWRVGRTEEDRLMYRKSIKAATSEDG